MKRIIYTTLIISILVIAISIFIQPIALFLVKRQTEKIFPGSAVSIRSCDLAPLRLLTFSGIEINRPPAYNLKVKQISIQYSPVPLLKQGISSSSLKHALISLDLEIDSLDMQGCRLDNASLNINQKQDSGALYIRQIRYGKAKIKEVKSRARLKEDVFFLDSLSAQTLGGQIQGGISFRIDNTREYLADIRFINLDLETLMNDFNLNKKVEMSGKLSGTLSLRGAGLDINALSGDFSTAEYGGILVIKDTRFLENLARSSQQPLEILVESFQDYHYNTGVMRLSLQQGNLILDAALDGEAGKRNLNITLHDFRLTREGL